MDRTTNLCLAAFLTAAFGLGFVNCCAREEIAKCLRTFVTPFQEGFNPFESQETFTELCHGSFATYKRCLRGKTSGCSEVTQNMFEGILNSYNYMCGQGKQGAVRYGECINGPKVKADLQRCQNTMMTKLQNNPDPDQDTRCEYFREFLGCGISSGQEQCGADAAVYYDNVIRVATAPLMEQVSCGCSGLAAMLGILGTALVFLLFIR